MNRSSLGLYLVTDSRFCAGRDLVEVVVEAVRGGVTIVQLREKEADTRRFVGLGRRMKAALVPYGVPLIINDRVDVALACGADGVHLGMSDMAVADARRLLGPDAVIGLSVESLGQLEAWKDNGDVDYFGVSPVFSTPTKTDTAPPFGLEGLRRAAAMTSRPLVAIGGINVGNAAEVVAAGADGLAVVSAVMGAENPRGAAERLKGFLK